MLTAPPSSHFHKTGAEFRTCACIIQLNVLMLSRSVMSDFATRSIVACQVLLFMEFTRQEYWSGLPFYSPRYLPYPDIELMSPALASWFFTTAPPGKNFRVISCMLYLYSSLLNKVNHVDTAQCHSRGWRHSFPHSLIFYLLEPAMCLSTMLNIVGKQMVKGEIGYWDKYLEETR